MPEADPGLKTAPAPADPQAQFTGLRPRRRRMPRLTARPKCGDHCRRSHRRTLLTRGTSAEQSFLFRSRRPGPFLDQSLRSTFVVCLPRRLLPYRRPEAAGRPPSPRRRVRKGRRYFAGTVDAVSIVMVRVRLMPRRTAGSACRHVPPGRKHAPLEDDTLRSGPSNSFVTLLFSSGSKPPVPNLCPDPWKIASSETSDPPMYRPEISTIASVEKSAGGGMGVNDKPKT